MPSDAKKKRAAAKKEAAKKRTQPQSKKDEETNGVSGACAGRQRLFSNSRIEITKTKALCSWDTDLNAQVYRSVEYHK